MRTFRILGGIFCVFGCVFALLGIVTSILPMIENEQFQLIVRSFQQPSADPLTNTLNSIVLFCLRSGYFLLLCGISLTVAGGLIGSSARKRLKVADQSLPVMTPAPASPDVSGMPKPAYYPGGLEPTTMSLMPEPDGENAAPIVSTMKMPTVELIEETEDTAPPVTDSDSQKLMHNDAVLSAQAQFKRPAAAPDYSRYPSNTAPETPSKEAQPAPPTHRPKIVSTIGKKPV